IIGLIAGVIFVGTDMIEASKIQAQMKQFDQLTAATQAFETKYNGLPGDLLAADASAYGMHSRNGASGRGDGNRHIDTANSASPSFTHFGGESALFWNDLAYSKLIEGDFTLDTGL